MQAVYPTRDPLELGFRDNAVAMSFASIGHALGQLEARSAAEQVGDSKTWRHRNGAA